MANPENHYHAVQFYKDEAALAGTVARFLADGFNAGHPGLVVATAPHAETISRQLATHGLPVAELETTGELVFCDARKMLASFMVDGLPNPTLFKTAVGQMIERLSAGRTPRPVRVYGEMVDMLWQDGNCDGAIKLELLWNQLTQSYEFSLLCGYAIGRFYKETRDPRYHEVCAQHSHILPLGG